MTRGNPDHSTREALLTYLRVDPQPVALIAITRYMKVMHKKDSGAVRECLRRLVKGGQVAHPARGIYQWKPESAPPAELETKPAALTTT
jgi:hypothetical protein